MIEALAHSASRLEWVVSAGAGLAGLIILLKVFGQGEIDFKGVKVKLSYAWVLMLLFTIAHAYAAILFVRRCYQLFFTSPEVAHKGWSRLTSGEFLWFDGLIERVKVITLPSGLRLYEMNLADPTTWLAHAAGLAIFIAIFRWRGAKMRVRVGTGLVAILLTLINWGIGSNWVVAASELSLNDQTKSTYMARWKDILADSR